MGGDGGGDVGFEVRGRGGRRMDWVTQLEISEVRREIVVNEGSHR